MWCVLVTVTGVAGREAQWESSEESGRQKERVTNRDNFSKEFCCKGELRIVLKAKGSMMGRI